MSRLPDKLDPQRAADQGRRLEGVVELSHLPRVAAVSDVDGGVSFDLEFFRDEKRRPCVRGSVKTVVRTVCQRCLESMDVIVDSELLIALVQGNEEAQRLPEEYDPFLLDEGLFDPADLIQDEIILAVPQIPMHSGESCGNADWRNSGDDQPDDESGADQTDNPFAVLAQLKKQIH